MVTAESSRESLAEEMSGARSLGKLFTAWKGWVPRCANSDCARTALAHAMARLHSGVLIAEEWFCGPDCFEQALRRRLLVMMSSRYAQEPAPRLRLPLGLVLISRGDLTAEQLKIALEEQSRTNENLGEVVQRLDFVTAEQVTAAVATQWSCPVFSLANRQLVPGVHIPRYLLERYGLLPVHYSETGRRLMVGFVSRVQYHILHTIEHITGCVAAPCFITAREYREKLNSPAFVERSNEIIMEQISGPFEMARLARNYVSQVGAQRTRFGVCRDYLWMRIWGPRHEMDLLFRMQCQ
jgi:hypothetical protein